MAWGDPDARKFNEVRIGLGAVGPKPIRARRAEEALKGVEITDWVIRTVDNLEGGVLGAVSLAFFIYTAIEMVQKIGFLLGEGASDTEKMLNSIVESFRQKKNAPGK